MEPSDRRRADEVICYGTVFVADLASVPVNIEQQVATGTPRFGSASVDSSFLANRALLLNGIKTSAAPTPIERIGGTDGRSSIAVHLNECSTDFCNQLVSLTAKQASDLAQYCFEMLSSMHREDALHEELAQRLGQFRKALAEGIRHDELAERRRQALQRIIDRQNSPCAHATPPAARRIRRRGTLN